jgi:hypothetical protein
MIIKINDKIEIRPVGGGILRDGIITSISISTNAQIDPAGENGAKVEELDLDLKYKGSIGYTDVTFNDEGDETGESKWAYFTQIVQPEGKNKKQWWEDNIYYGQKNYRDV